MSLFVVVAKRVRKNGVVQSEHKIFQLEIEICPPNSILLAVNRLDSFTAKQ